MSHERIPVHHILFDAAETLITKPDLLDRLCRTLELSGHSLDLGFVRERHKIVSESIQFPDKPDLEFYQVFNARLLATLGVPPSQALVEEVFAACRGLDWNAFDDTASLHELNQPISVLSNFHRGLYNILNQFFDDMFEHVFVSEELGTAKPNTDFFQIALERLGCEPKHVLYVGDSIFLDMRPAAQLGMQVCLIDRHHHFEHFTPRVSDLSQLVYFLT